MTSRSPLPLLPFITVTLLSFAATTEVAAFAIIEGDHRETVTTTYLGVEYRVNLVPGTVAHLPVGATAQHRILMGNQFPGWIFIAATAAAPGTVTVEEYDAIAKPQGLPDSLGGADLSLLYDDNNDDSVTTWRWIQIILSTSEETGYPYTKNPSVDPPTPAEGGIDDDLPFYFTNAQLGGFDANIRGDSIWKGKTPIPIQNPAGGGDLRFFDEPSGFLTNAYMRNDFYLYLVSWAGGDSKTVTLYDGIGWGFEIIPEPATLALLGLGLAGLGVARRRKAA